MPENHDPAPIDRRGRYPADRPRPGSRVAPRLELLEARCLLSGLSAYDATPADRPQTQTDVELADARSLPAPESALGGSSRSAAALPSDHLQLGPRDHDEDQGVAPDDPGGISHESYVVVNEGSAPHGTMATAQDLPNLPYFGVIGTLGPEDEIDLFRLPVGEGTSAIEFDLIAHSAVPSVPVRFLVFSGSGQLLGQWTSGDGSGPESLRVDLGGLPRGSALFLGTEVVGSTGSAAPAPAVGYQLWVTSLSAAAQASAGAGASRPAPAPPPPLVAGPFAAPANLSAAGPTGSAPGATGLAMRLAAGALPARSAGPLGGVMAGDRDPTPPARSPGMAASLDADDRALRTAGLAPETEMGNAPVSSRDEGAKALVALRGPGGSPFLGATAVGNWLSASPASAVGPDELASGSELDADPDESPVARGDVPPAVASLTSTDALPPAQPESESAAFPTGDDLRVPVSSGLGLAIAVTLNAAFSDPCAGFDALASRLDPGSGRPAPAHSRRRDRGTSPAG